MKKKKKKKHSHHRGDQAKVANLQRFANVISGLFDQQLSDGMCVCELNKKNDFLTPHR